MKPISISIIIISILSIAYSFAVPAYTNEDKYQEMYMAIDVRELGSRIASDRFHENRDKFLTHKYLFQDYGATFLILGIASLLLFGANKPVTAPSSKLKIALVGFTAALFTVIGYVGDLFVEAFRGSFPWWADSLGIPLAGAPVLAFIFICWVILNLIAMRDPFKAGAPISFGKIRGSNYFYLLLLLATALIVMLCVAGAYFWMVLPGVLWLYFYASLWAGRYAANN